MRRLLALLLCIPPAAAQQLSPRAAYDEATRPIEIVHRSVTNWSDTEKLSLSIAISKATAACAARKPTDYTDDDLIAYAQLCGLGLNWPMVGVAATQYIATPGPKPKLPLAYALKLESALNAHDLAAIMNTGKSMLEANPYDPTIDAATNEALDYLQLAYTAEALDLHHLRQPLLLAALATPVPSIPIHSLYADLLAQAALQQYAGQPEQAAATVTVLDQTLTARPQTPADESLLIAASRRRYALLGQPLPKLDLQLSLLDLQSKPAIDPETAASTAFLLFPAWCAQCINMVATQLPQASEVLSHSAVHVYALLAEPAPTLATLKAPTQPPRPDQQLLKTPTYIVPESTLDALSAPDFPWLLVVDHAGILRFAALAPETALKTGDFLDRATDHIAEQYPSKFVPQIAKPAP